MPGFCARLQEPRRFLQVLAGSRQVGKTTLVRQALSTLNQQPGAVFWCWTKCKSQPCYAGCLTWPVATAGNTTTLAHYLELLEGAGMVCGLQKYSGQVVRQRGSSPKLQVFNTALMGVNAMLEGFDLNRLRATPELWGRITESAVGAELLARHLAHSSTQPQIYYWRDGVNEVDDVLRQRGELFAFEVKSGVNQGNVKGLDAFCKLNPTARPLILGAGGLPLQNWFAAA